MAAGAGAGVRRFPPRPSLGCRAGGCQASLTLGSPGSSAAVAHLLWEQEAGGSNPPSPTQRTHQVIEFIGRAAARYQPKTVELVW
jgi:hypothetical protein